MYQLFFQSKITKKWNVMVHKSELIFRGFQVGVFVFAGSWTKKREVYYFGGEVVWGGFFMQLDPDEVCFNP